MRILGFRRRRIHALGLAGLIAIAGTLAVVLPAFAVAGTGLFELDGNAVTTHAGTSAPDDWDRVCHDVTNDGTVFNSFGTGTDSADHSVGTLCPAGGIAATTTNGADALEFTHQPANSVSFSGGGSKDAQAISQWAYNLGTGGNPSKDILLDGFAAKYHKPSSTDCPTLNQSVNPPVAVTDGSTTCKLLLFGMDRLDNSGDAQNGFWFFQNAIGLTTNKCPSGSCFSGTHKNGDVLVTTDFSIGGTTSTISVYAWDSTCTGAAKVVTAGACASANLRLLGTSIDASCTTESTGGAFCGIVNPGPSDTAPWPFVDKSGNNGTFAQGEFFEGGLNISDLQGLNANECFSSSLAESRSSTSTDAVLKVFILGNFGACTSSTSTTPSAGQNGSSTIPANAQQTETDSANITVTGGASTFGGTVSYFLCGPILPIPDPSTDTSTCAHGSGVQIGAAKTATGSGGTATVTSDTAVVTSIGEYCWRAEYSGDAANSIPASADGRHTECFTLTPAAPTLTTAATDTNGGVLPSTITDTATLTGTANEPGTHGITGSCPAALGSTFQNCIYNQGTGNTYGGPAAGQITFTAFGPDTCSTTAKTATNVTVSGDSSTTNVYSTSFTPTLPGTYTWVASYNGDSPNTKSAVETRADSTQETCANETNTDTEHVTVTDTATPSSAQKWYPNDSAKVDSASGDNDLVGTLTLQLYTGGTCTGGVLTGATAVTGASYTSGAVTTATNEIKVSSGTQTTYGFTSTTTAVWWLVTFTSTNDVPSTSYCESSSLTITN